MARIGVFVCHCGENIAGVVDVKAVAEEARGLPGVAFVSDYRYMCSEPGQSRLRQAIKKHRLTAVVVAACSPHMHEHTFRNAAAATGLNPYLLEMANIREQCSWVHTDKKAATAKAAALLRQAVEKVKKNEPLIPIRLPITRKALVIGGGIAGIQAALDIASGGQQVLLVEKTPSIGGHMAQLSETFPTLDCSQCILTPRMVEAARHPHITLLAFAEVEEVAGYIGNFQVKLRKKARSVDASRCTGCGECYQCCPVQDIASEFDEGLGKRSAIYIPFLQAVPNVPVIDRAHCLWFTRGECRICEKVCPRSAIDFEQEDEVISEEVGAIVVATGFSLQPNIYGEYGYDKYQDVISGLQFERLLSATGPTEGEVRRPSDNKVPESVAFIACVGSRDPAKGIPYCSKVCCMYIAKQAMLYRHKVPGGRAFVFYMDIRAGGKNFEEFVRRAIEEDGVEYIRGRVSRIYRKGDSLILKAADTILGELVELGVDMVVLANATSAREDAQQLARKLRIPCDEHNFLTEAHPKLRPVETNTAGVFLAGACQGPKDIPDSVAQASAAGAKVLALFAREELEKEPLVARVSRKPPPLYSTCTGCFNCERVCPYEAVERQELLDHHGNLIKTIARVNEKVCTGCGLCVAACPNGSINLAHTTEEQVFGQINAL